MTLGNIIKAYRKEHHMSMDDFAKVSGMSKTYVWMLEKNINPKTGKKIVPTIKYIQMASKGMHMEFDELFSMVRETVKIQLDDTVIGRKAICVPVFDRVPAETSTSEIENIHDYEEISEELAHTGKFFALKIKDNSMEPKIEKGAILIARHQEDAESGSIVTVHVNGDDAVCKKLIKSKNYLSLVSLNPDYDPMIFSYEETKKLPVKIIGKVVEIRIKCEK